jgi:glycerol kinase
MTNRYIVALDQGTTSSRAVLFDGHGRMLGMAQREIKQHYPQPGWVEHDPQEIWESQRDMLEQVVREHNIAPSAIAAIGITNQRETTMVWNRKTGQPVCPAIVWQDRRTAPICEALKSAGLTDYIRRNTGLVVDPYFSGTKLKWILEHIPGAHESASRGELLFGTVDTWLIWNLTHGATHATDCSNASRTMLFNIHSLQWDAKLLDVLGIPANMLPEVRDSSGAFGTCDFHGAKIPILGVAGDQQAALFGQACFDAGMAKNTYGTGCFLLMNTGDKPCHSHSGLISTVAWRMQGKTQYALEGSVLIAGAAIQWMRDELRIIENAAAAETLAMQAGDVEDVYVVPAFAGLGAPHWDMYARGAIFGLTRDTTREQIVKATLESLAFQTRDVLVAMQHDTNIQLKTLRVDGGAAANNYLMQFQSDILNVGVERPRVIQSTAQGAACLAGIAAGMWDQKQIAARREIDRTFTPKMSTDRRDARCRKWQRAIQRTTGWLADN